MDGIETRSESQCLVELPETLFGLHQIKAAKPDAARLLELREDVLRCVLGSIRRPRSVLMLSEGHCSGSGC